MTMFVSQTLLVTSFLYSESIANYRNNCPDFPFFTEDAHKMMEAAKFASTDFDSYGGGSGSDLSVVSLPPLAKYVHLHKAAGCLNVEESSDVDDESEESDYSYYDYGGPDEHSYDEWVAERVKFSITVTGPDGHEESDKMVCWIDKLRQFFEKLIEEVNCPSMHPRVVSCGVYNVSLSATTENGTLHHLGSKSMELPTHAPLAKIEEGGTYVKLGFQEPFRDCRPNSSYLVHCGKQRKKMTQQDTVKLNLFPMVSSRGENNYGRYECQATKEGSSISQTIDFMHGEGERTVMTFSYHDHGIFLVQDGKYADEVLNSPNFTVSVSVKDLTTKEVINATGLEAAREGILGLRSSDTYEACLHLEQVNGSCNYECKEHKFCEIVTTLPAGTLHESLTAIWALQAALTFFLLILGVAAIFMWRRINALHDGESMTFHSSSQIQLSALEESASIREEESRENFA